MDDDFGYGELDLDGNGYAETLTYDTDADGYVDAVEIDRDGDGWTDLLVADTDGDGLADTAAEAVGAPPPQPVSLGAVDFDSYYPDPESDPGNGFSTGNAGTDAVLGYIDSDVAGTVADVDHTIDHVISDPASGIAPPGGGDVFESGVDPMGVHDEIMDDIDDRANLEDARDATRDAEMQVWKDDMGYPSGPYDDMANDGSIMY